MARQIINVGSAANDGTGDTLRAAGAKMNANFDEIDKAVRSLNAGRRPIIATAGDSIAAAFLGTDMNVGPIAYALALTGLDVYYDPSNANNDGSGGYNFGLGGSPSSYLLTDWAGNTAIITKLAAKAVKPDILFVQSLQNDFMGITAAAADVLVANMTTFATQALALGVQLVVLCPRPPYNGQAASNLPQGHAYVNQRLEAFARATQGVVFMNYLPDVKAISDANENNGASSVVAWRGTAGTGGYTADGVHFGAMSARVIAPYVTRILSPFARRAVPRASMFASYHPTNYPYVSLYGRNGMMVGTAGQYNGSANTNVAGSSSAGLDSRWTLTDNNGIVATPSIITHADGYARQRLTLSGTATAAASVTLTLAFYQDVASAPFMGEAMLDFSNVNGLTSWGMSIGNAPSWGQNVSQVGTLNDKLFLRTPDSWVFSNSGFSNRPATLTLNVASGATVSGTVDLGRIGAWKMG